MKLRYLLSALAGIALLASCKEEPPVASYDLAIELSQSVIAIPTEGGSKTVEVNSGDVTWNATSDTKWITFTPATGKGKTNVTVTVGESLDDRTGEIVIAAEGVEKYITVIQTGDPHGLAEDDPLTCAEAVELCGKLADKATTGKKYYVKGIISNIVEEFGTQYGNATFWMGDKEGEKTFEAYRVYYFDNAKYDDPAKQNISVGDNVVIYGILMNYGGQAETSQNAAYLYKLDANTAPALSCKEPEVVVGPSTTEASFDITVKNLTGKWTVTKDAESTWVKSFTQEGTESGTIAIELDANEGAERVATFTVKSDGAKDLTLTLKQLEYLENGTAEKPFTVAEAIEFCSGLSAATSDSYYVKGKFVKWNKETDAFGANDYGNAAFWISEDGKEYLTEDGKNDLTKMIEAYQVNWFDGEKWKTGDGNIGFGDEVVVCGPLTTYKGTAETAGKGAAHIYSINGYTAWEAGISSTAPLTIEEAITKALATTEPTPLQYFVKGKFVRWNKDSDAFGANTYGNASFWLSEDGTDYNDKAKEFEAYQVNWLGGEKWAEGNHTLAAGDEVVVRGQLTKYNTTAETTGKSSSYVFSVNGKYSEAEWAE